MLQWWFSWTIIHKTGGFRLVKQLPWLIGRVHNWRYMEVPEHGWFIMGVPPFQETTNLALTWFVINLVAWESPVFVWPLSTFFKGVLMPVFGGTNPAWLISEQCVVSPEMQQPEGTSYTHFWIAWLEKYIVYSLYIIVWCKPTIQCTSCITQNHGDR